MEHSKHERTNFFCMEISEDFNGDGMEVNNANAKQKINKSRTVVH